jgi:hypothetical protein
MKKYTLRTLTKSLYEANESYSKADNQSYKRAYETWR